MIFSDLIWRRKKKVLLSDPKSGHHQDKFFRLPSQSHEGKCALPQSSGMCPSRVLLAPTSSQHFEGMELMHLAHTVYGKTIFFFFFWCWQRNWLNLWAVSVSTQWWQKSGQQKARAELSFLLLACEGQVEMVLHVGVILWIWMWQDKGIHLAGRQPRLCAVPSCFL